MEYSYSVLQYKQRPASQGAPTFCVFHAPVGEVLEWAEIDRLAHDNKQGVQRATKGAKIRSVQRFFDKDVRNTIPTAVIVTVEKPTITQVKCANAKADVAFHELSVAVSVGPDGKTSKPGLVIDGQHRLLGMAKVDPKLSVPVVALIDADDSEKAFQFIVINNRASKVSPDHYKALQLHFDEGQLDKRLAEVRLGLRREVTTVKVADIDEASPFRGMIDWAVTPKPDRLIQPTAVENAIAYVMLKGGRDLEEDEPAQEFLFAIWRTVRNLWPNAWAGNAEHGRRILSKVGIICMTQYLTDNLAAFARMSPVPIDLTEPTQVEELARRLLGLLPEDFWLVKWTGTSYDTAAGRGQVLQALSDVQDNVKAGVPWYEKVDLIDPVARK